MSHSELDLSALYTQLKERSKQGELAADRQAAKREIRSARKEIEDLRNEYESAREELQSCSPKLERKVRKYEAARLLEKIEQKKRDLESWQTRLALYIGFERVYSRIETADSAEKYDEEQLSRDVVQLLSEREITASQIDEVLVALGLPRKNTLGTSPGFQ